MKLYWILCMLAVFSCKPKDGNGGRRIIQTKNDLRQLQILVMGDLPEQLFATSGAGESGSMYEFIERLPDKEKGLFSSIRIQDAWDLVFYYKYISNDKLFIWSFGPNKADDEGGGDDIGIVITREDLFN